VTWLTVERAGGLKRITVNGCPLSGEISKEACVSAMIEDAIVSERSFAKKAITLIALEILGISPPSPVERWQGQVQLLSDWRLPEQPRDLEGGLLFLAQNYTP
jgi:hypothetical protein